MNTAPEFVTPVAAFRRAAAPRARTRTLAAANVAGALGAHTYAVACLPGETVVTTVVGGYVANSYGSAAESDRLRLTTTPDGGTTYEAGRVGAASRPYGRGPALVQRALRPGQVQGRVLPPPAELTPRAAP